VPDKDRDKNSLLNEAEAAAKVSKEIEMRYFSFNKILVEKEKRFFLNTQRIKSTQQSH